MGCERKEAASIPVNIANQTVSSDTKLNLQQVVISIEKSIDQAYQPNLLISIRGFEKRFDVFLTEEGIKESTRLNSLINEKLKRFNYIEELASEVKEQKNFLLDLCIVNNIEWQKFKCNKNAARVSDEFSVLFQTFRESTTTADIVFGLKCINGAMPSSCANKQYVADATYDLLEDGSIIQYTHSNGCSIPNKFTMDNGLLYQDYAGDATGTCGEQQLYAVKRTKELGKRRLFSTKI